MEVTNMAKGKRETYDEVMSESIKEEVKEITEKSPTKEEVKEITKKSHAKAETTVPETVNGVVVNALNVNVRRWPDKDSEVVETLRAGDRVVIYGKRGDFYEVSTSVNHRVYISSEFLMEE